MSLPINKILPAVVLLLWIYPGIYAQTVRIMPLGNSITFDENSLDKSNPRPDGDRISYRYRLFQLLHDEGYDFDYVGSENSGNNYFFNSELDDNAGFPGIETWQLANLIQTGYNPMQGVQESPGPYLYSFPADLILLHIGTNNLIESSGEVKDLLDNIRSYDPDVFILVARIINRRTYHPSTSAFNNNVELMVNMRGDPRIQMVDMENGAGINYATDMIDNLHPNQAGYDKMAFKWFEAVNSLNQAPVTTFIPDQYTSRGTPFPDIELDEYVEDPEDPDDQLSWSFEQKLGSQLIVSIDENRVLSASPNGDWYGTEILTLRVEDTGSGLFPRNQIIQVVYNVSKGNDPPVIESTPPTEVFQEEPYSYTIQAVDIDNDPMSFSAIQKPSWLNFDTGTHLLSGVPHNEDVGIHQVTLRVSDGKEFSEQSFQVEVIDVNDPPFFTSAPVLEAEQGELYSYVIYATDPEGDPISYGAVTLPDWMEFDSINRVLRGTPAYTDVGDHDVRLRVSDAMGSTDQSFTLNVIDSNDPPQFISDALTVIDQDAAYYYNVIARDTDGDPLTYSAPLLPYWLTFNDGDLTLTGQPGNSEVGVHDVVIRVTDGFVETDQSFQVEVMNVNDPPVFLSEALTEARAMEVYIYSIEAEDVDPGDQLSFSTVVKPDWLTLSGGETDAILFGTPTMDEIGSHAVIIQASDGKEAALQGYTLKVLWPTSTDNQGVRESIRLFPNPSDHMINLTWDGISEINLKIYSSAGILMKSVTSGTTGHFRLDISDLERGIYVYKVKVNGLEETGKLIKN